MVESSGLKKWARYGSKVLLDGLGVPLMAFAYLIPRRRDLWCFGAYRGHYYGDHSRMLFEEVLNKNPEISAFWSTRSKEVYDFLKAKGLPVVYARSLRGLIYTARAGVCVYTFDSQDHNLVAAHGAFHVQLWHGIPLKGFKADSGLLKRRRRTLAGWCVHRALTLRGKLFPWTKPKWDILFFQSALDRERTGSAFRGSFHQGQVLGSIRAEWLGRHRVGARSMHENSAVLRILYAPTHRGHGAVRLFERVPVPERTDFNRLLDRYNARIEVRLHPLQVHEQLPSALLGERVLVRANPGVEDIYYSLVDCDVVITDYSSIFVDAVGADIPVVCLAPDSEDYAENDAGFYTGIEEFPGPVVDTWEQAIKACDDLVRSRDKQWEEVCSRAKTFYYGQSSTDDRTVMQRAVSEIRDLL